MRAACSLIVAIALCAGCSAPRDTGGPPATRAGTLAERATEQAHSAGGVILADVPLLEPPAAAVLADLGAYLSLDRLINLSPEVAASLAGHRGSLFLDGLTTLGPEAAGALAEHRGELSLCGLPSLTPETAAALARHEGDLLLDGLKTLPVETAVALARHQGTLSLDGLTALSPEAAAALATHDGLLSLNRLPTGFPREVGEALAKHQGGLLLNSMLELPGGVGETLLARPDVQLPEKAFVRPTVTTPPTRAQPPRPLRDQVDSPSAGRPLPAGPSPPDAEVSTQPR